MSHEDKELLLKDVCARLPYGVKCRIKGEKSKILVGIEPEGLLFRARIPDKSDWCYDCYDIEEWSILPYLRPMTSMTEKEIEEFENFVFPYEEDENGNYQAGVLEKDIPAYIDWLTSHHFDYRGLIEKGLAIEALEGMYK